MDGVAGIQGRADSELGCALHRFAQGRQSEPYCDEIKGKVEACGLQIIELSTHLQGQFVAVTPAYDLLFDGVAPAAVRGNPPQRTARAMEQLHLAAKASRNLGLVALQWHTFYAESPRPAGLVADGFAELARRWVPILNASTARNSSDSTPICCVAW